MSITAVLLPLVAYTYLLTLPRIYSYMQPRHAVVLHIVCCGSPNNVQVRIKLTWINNVHVTDRVVSLKWKLEWCKLWSGRFTQKLRTSNVRKSRIDCTWVSNLCIHRDRRYCHFGSHRTLKTWSKNSYNDVEIYVTIWWTTHQDKLSVVDTRSEVITKMNIQISVVRDVTLCSSIDGYQSFEGISCLHLQVR
jgi:hypothetical protein